VSHNGTGSTWQLRATLGSLLVDIEGHFFEREGLPHISPDNQVVWIGFSMLSFARLMLKPESIRTVEGSKRALFGCGIGDSYGPSKVASRLYRDGTEMVPYKREVDDTVAEPHADARQRI
jgi:hypothetical protein